MIDREMPLEPLEPQYRGEVAERYRYRDGSGEIGVIASVSQPFCGDCTRARISADGHLYTCLFGVIGHDLRELLRCGQDATRRSRRSCERCGAAGRPLLGAARVGDAGAARSRRCRTSGGRP